MKGKISLIPISLMLLFSMNSLLAQNFWQYKESIKSSIEPSEIISFIDHYKLVELDLEGLRNELKNAPEEFSGKKGLDVDFPLANGEIKTFKVFHSSIIEPGLQAKFPEMRNYKIFTRDGKYSGRIGLTVHGFHGVIQTPEGKLFIDKYSDESLTNYVSYYTKDYQKDMSVLPSCGVTKSDTEKYLEGFDFEEIETPSKSISSRTPEGEVKLRTYRAAIACTGEWGATKGGTVEKALAAVNESLTKINEIFESEVGIRLILIEDNDKLMHLNANTDPYVNSNMGAALIGQNTIAIGNIIGLNSFDIG